MPGPFTEGNPIDHTVSDGAGTVWPFASVQVNVHGGGAASLFSDAGRTVSVANPLTAGSDGAVRFFVAAGDYDFVATSETGAAHTVYVTVAQQVADTPVLQSSLAAQLAACVPQGAGTSASGPVAVHASGVSFEAGPSTAVPRGAPTFTPTCSSGGAGVLTGAYKYAYSEVDLTGETTLSPLSATYTAAGEQIQVIFGLPRRGAVTRRLYRTKAGGSSFFAVPAANTLMGGGTDYRQTVYVDNTADTALGGAAPVSDTSGVINFRVNQSVKYWTSGPDQGANPADVTILTSDGITAGTFSVDSYGPMQVRTMAGTSFSSEKVTSADGSNQATLGYHFRATVATAALGAASAEVFRMAPHGHINLAPDDNENTTVFNIAPAVAQTLAAAVAQISLPIGTTIPALTIDNQSGIGLWVSPSGPFTNGTGAIRVDLPASSTGPALFLNSLSSGDIIRDHANAFRVQSGGNLNLFGVASGVKNFARQWQLQPAAVGDIPFTVQQLTSQTADMELYVASNGSTVLAGRNASGQPYIAAGTAPSAVAGRGFIYVATDGTLHYRGPTTDTQLAIA